MTLQTKTPGSRVRVKTNHAKGCHAGKFELSKIMSLGFTMLTFKPRVCTFQMSGRWGTPSFEFFKRAPHHCGPP